jgi:cytidyltransferase-like protein
MSKRPIKKILLEDNRQKDTLVMTFGRMNPVTAGHEKVITTVKKHAEKLGADHIVIASGSHGDEKNPLTPNQKLKHLKRAFPQTRIKVADKENPTIMHHVKDASKKGYKHLVVIGGGDRVKHYQKLLKHYNGTEYNFASIKVKSAGERNANHISATEMRNHVRNNNYYQFKKACPEAIKANDTLSRELFNDVKKRLKMSDAKARETKEKPKKK